MRFITGRGIAFEVYSSKQSTFDFAVRLLVPARQQTEWSKRNDDRPLVG
jgi:hypothetical protein